MFGIEKVYALMMSDPNVELVTTKKGKKYTTRHFRNGILHIVASVNNTTSELISLKILKIF